MIAIGCDHGGYELKEKIKSKLLNIEFKDFGTFSTERVDFPNIAFKVSESVAKEECKCGILICKSGIGMSIASNKVKRIRCALCYSIDAAKSAKEHNNANVIALPAEFVGVDEAIEIIKIWLDSKFLGDRYEERLKLIKDYEEVEE